MKKVLIIFGSGSDEPVYSAISKALKGIPHEARVASAHRTPDLVENILKKKWGAVFAGAGVSAALPGAVAAGTIRPVFGVPVDGNLGGLDAFLSISQMPPGIPVAGLPCGSKAVDYIKKEKPALKLMLEGRLKGVNIIGEAENKRVLEAIDLLTGIGIPVMISNMLEKDAVNIHVFKGIKPKIAGKGLKINVPLIDKSTVKDAVELLKNSADGLWVGVNRADNAALLAVQMLNDGKYDEFLLDGRKKGRAKVNKQDKTARTKFKG